MKKTLALALVSILFVACSSASKQTAQDTTSATSAATTPDEHAAHHAAEAATTPAAAGAPMGDMSGMMGKMDMTQMKGMMEQCMSMHKDGKMCNQETMQKCEANMKKGECEKMMKQAKNAAKPSKKSNQ